MSFSNKCILLVFVFGVIWLGIHQYNSTLIKNGQMQCVNEVLTDTIDYQKWSAAITDEAVKEFVGNKVTIVLSNEETRKEAIDAYFEDEGFTAKNNKDDAKVVDHSSDVRVAKLANRMREYYCTARPDDLQCNTVNIPNKVPDVAPSK